MDSRRSALKASERGVKVEFEGPNQPERRGDEQRIIRWIKKEISDVAEHSAGDKTEEWTDRGMKGGFVSRKKEGGAFPGGACRPLQITRFGSQTS